jgi:hypothetical protein
MAKVSFSKLGLKSVNTEVKTVDFNEQTIEVKQYLPIQEKLDLISRVLNLAHDQDNNFSNPVKRSVLLTLEIMYAYTNINFTDKQKEDPAKLFDLLDGSGLVDVVFEAIPQYELNTLEDGVKETTEAFYKYQNSILGLLDTMKQDYSDLDFDIAKLQEGIQNPEMVGFLKDVLTKMG